MTKLLKYIIPFSILLGTILVAFGLSNVEGATIIHNESINYGTYTWTYKVIDLKLYLQNLEEQLNINTVISMFPNQPELPTTPADTDILGWIKFVASILLQYIANWIIYALNYLLLAPLKIILYPANIIITILGLNTTEESYIKVLRSIYQFQLPYIPYFN